MNVEKRKTNLLLIAKKQTNSHLYQFKFQQRVSIEVQHAPYINSITDVYSGKVVYWKLVLV